jgi:PTH1 family peptidyl-tRNA hydrolase
MNLSGEAVKYFYDKYEIEKENILVVYDDVNLDLGTLRLRPSGSDGGQKGIKSIIYHMETDEIPRLRFGIKCGVDFDELKAKEDFSLAEYVLSPFEENEAGLFEKSTERAKNAVISFIENGIKETMNLYNGKLQDTENGNNNSKEENNTN